MRTPLLELNLSNVIARCRTKPLQQISVSDLLLPMREVQAADRITLTDGENVSVLKDRRQTVNMKMFYPVGTN
jgi:hypothetical protein